MGYARHCTRREPYKALKNRSVVGGHTREIGEVISQFSRFLVCRTTRKLRLSLGDPVYSETGEEVGRVVDIFGPVRSPYLKILKKDGRSARTVYFR